MKVRIEIDTPTIWGLKNKLTMLMDQIDESMRKQQLTDDDEFELEDASTLSQGGECDVTILESRGREWAMSRVEEMWEACPANVQKRLMLIAAECDKACLKHPQWPSDPIHAAAIIAEESGELIRAALQNSYENGHEVEMTKEAIQTGAMALRFLIYCEVSNIKNP